MVPHHVDRLLHLRSRVEGELKTTAALQAHIEDPSLRRRLERASNVLRDIERVFLSRLQSPDDSTAARSAWLDTAEWVLDAAIDERRLVEESAVCSQIR
jgi:hypothetical protein